MHAATVPQRLGMFCHERVQIVHRNARPGDVLGGDLIAFDHVFIRRTVLLLAGRGRGPNQFRAGRVALEGGEDIGEAGAETRHAAVESVVEMNHGVSVLPQHQFDLIQQRRIAHRLRRAQHRDIGAILQRRAHFGGITYGDGIADEQHEGQRRTVGRPGLDRDGTPIVGLARQAVVVAVFCQRRSQRKGQLPQGGTGEEQSFHRPVGIGFQN